MNFEYSKIFLIVHACSITANMTDTKRVELSLDQNIPFSKGSQ